MMKLRYKSHILTIFLLLSLSVNILLFTLWKSSLSQDHIQLNRYPFLLSQSIYRSYLNNHVVNFLPLRQQIDKEVKPYSDTFALYFEYLPNSTNFNVNGDEEFSAESLLKVPVVMAYYHMKENVGITQDPTVAIRTNELNNKFGDLYKKGPGYKINLADAIKLALQKSDNTASLVIADQVSNYDFDYVYDGLGINEMTIKNSPVITPEEYANILKALYFSSILNNDDSEKILEILTKTDFSDMLPAGIPKNISIAHKIGVAPGKLYSDCGIVYVPMHPYILCMVSESGLLPARERMKKISTMIYAYISHL